MKYQIGGKYLKKRSNKKRADKRAHEVFVFVVCKSQEMQKYHQKQGVGKNMRQDNFEYACIGFGACKIYLTSQIVGCYRVWCETYLVRKKQGGA